MSSKVRREGEQSSKEDEDEDEEEQELKQLKLRPVRVSSSSWELLVGRCCAAVSASGKTGGKGREGNRKAPSTLTVELARSLLRTTNYALHTYTVRAPSPSPRLCRPLLPIPPTDLSSPPTPPYDSLHSSLHHPPMIRHLSIHTSFDPTNALFWHLGASVSGCSDAHTWTVCQQSPRAAP